jgi:hypothetical protein
LAHNPAKFFARSSLAFLLLLSLIDHPSGQTQRTSNTDLAKLLLVLHQKASALESSPGMRSSFESFLASHKLPSDSVRYSDFVLARLLFEATRDAGLWNLHWSITDQPPNSDRIWQQWKSITRPSVLQSTATAECDELSALYAFLATRAGLKDVGRFWPYPNHTVAVWVVQPTNHPAVRVVVPTSQIFLTDVDMFDTKSFDPWRQKQIYPYTRRDVPDTYVLSEGLFQFFVQQIDKYAAASDATLQRLRYLREAVLLRNTTCDQAARQALRLRDALPTTATEDRLAYANFASDLRSEPQNVPQ